MKEANVLTHKLENGEQLHLSAIENAVRILFVCTGETVHGDLQLKQGTLYIPTPQEALTLTAAADCEVLEIQRLVTREEYAQCKAMEAYVLPYDEAPTYTEACKSPKTISRELVPARLIPRFAMGSVQTKGEDLIAPHRHPDVEQYFYSLAENDCILLVDDTQQPFGGNDLVHIPLGSNHGVKLEEQHTCHYLWIDFLLNAKALEYLDSAHTMIEK